VLNPDRVLLGGLHRDLMAADPERLRGAVAKRSPWGRGSTVPLLPCALDQGGLIGAAELAWQPVLDDPSILGPSLNAQNLPTGRLRQDPVRELIADRNGQEHQRVFSSISRISAVVAVSPSLGKIRSMLLRWASASRSVIASVARTTW